MAEPTPEPPEPGEPEPTPTPEPEGDDVAKWKALSRKNEKEAKAARAELEKLQAASMSEQEKAVTAARDEGKAEATAALQLDRVRDKIEAKAGGKLADPDDAAALLGDLTRFVADDGSVDTKAIVSAIDALVKSKPYLSVQPGNGSGEGGPRGAGPSSSTPDPLLDAVQRAVGGVSR